MTTTAEFGPTLKHYREKRGISQSRLAELAEFDHSHVSRLETGARMPTRDAVERLAKALCLDGPGVGAMLVAAGFAATDDPLVAEVRDLIQEPAARTAVEGFVACLRSVKQYARQLGVPF